MASIHSPLDGRTVDDVILRHRVYSQTNSLSEDTTRYLADLMIKRAKEKWRGVKYVKREKENATQNANGS